MPRAPRPDKPLQSIQQRLAIFVDETVNDIADAERKEARQAEQIQQLRALLERSVTMLSSLELPERGISEQERQEISHFKDEIEQALAKEV